MRRRWWRRGMTRVARRLAWSRNPLYRTTDRLEGLLLLLTILAAILAVPVAVAVGQRTHEEGMRTTRAQIATGRWEKARLLEAAPSTVTSLPDTPTDLTALARATWRGPDGTMREGQVPVRPGTPAGATVRTWIDSSGRATQPPLTASQVSDRAVATGLTTWLAIELGVVVVYIFLRWLLDRRRLASWRSEWEQVAPRWTGRSR
ncbi:Rv1733c family protein [Thermasporomyces composti]|uniref:Uncharacterized protein n=1 Tax=Thermasporomyces composti TaxID=696763 RepID=A0A3D9V8I7_THECX|nr:hypothetical protein [Thermasporomyces composti]REF38108.1 hypothetical protein DFJ64_3578 [Thermasporomyces composti]